MNLLDSCLKSHLIDWLFTVLHPAQEFFTYMETSSLLVKGCKMLAYARRSGPLSREGSLSCHTCCDKGPRFFRSHPKDHPFSRLLRHTRGCGGSILTRILAFNGIKVKIIWNCPISLKPEVLKYVLKLIRTSPINLIYSCSLYQGTSGGMYFVTIWNGPVPLKQGVHKYFKNCWDTNPKP
jgi:hypothetical protein